MTVQILVGDCRARLRQMEAGTVQTCVTSPPYFGLRDYGHAGQIGLEPTPDDFVAAMVEVFREVRRVLRDDGTVWLNLGDSYARNPAKGTTGTPNGRNIAEQGYSGGAGIPDGAKEKDLIGIPWMVAFALRADGWYLRQDIIWAKPNPMPESVTDRCTKAHEYIFLLSKGPRYFFDAKAIAEPAIYAPGATTEVEREKGYYGGKWSNPEEGSRHDGSFKAIRDTRNKRSVWTVASQPFADAHFATYPPDLIEPCILAGTPVACCAACGAPRVPVLDRTPMVIRKSGRGDALGEHGATAASGTMVSPARSVVTGHAPSCGCNVQDGVSTVLDPFGGAGTTGLVADRLGRNAVLCELNPAYAAMAEKRLRADGGMFIDVSVDAPVADEAA